MVAKPQQQMEMSAWEAMQKAATEFLNRAGIRQSSMVDAPVFTADQGASLAAIQRAMIATAGPNSDFATFETAPDVFTGEQRASMMQSQREFLASLFKKGKR